MSELIRKIIRKFGYDIVRYKGYNPGRFAFLDMSKFVYEEKPLIFDVGANIGQSINLFKKQFPQSIIHSFEPSPKTFEILEKANANRNDVHLWNIALGSKVEQKELLENSHSDMSSFLPLAEFGWGEIKTRTIVPVSTIDQFCNENNIKHIDILKIDTQGFDFDVIKGAEKAILENRIGLLYFEIIFSEQYKGLPPVAEIFDYLFTHGFKLVTLYSFAIQQGLASWTNGLFIHNSYLPNTVKNE